MSDDKKPTKRAAETRVGDAPKATRADLATGRSPNEVEGFVGEILDRLADLEAGGGGGGSVSDATTTDKGVIQLAGDLDGTADAPTVPGLSGKLSRSMNLIDLQDINAARSNLMLGDAAERFVGTGPGQVAAADDARITGAAQKSANLSDLGSASAARTALGLGAAATLAVGTTAGTVAAGDDSRITDAIAKTLVDAKGDLLVGSGNDTVIRVPVGSTDGHALVVASGQPSGVQWAAPAAAASPPPPGYWSSESSGFLAWSFDPLIFETSTYMTNTGVLELARLTLPVGKSVTRAHVAITGQSGTYNATAGQVFAALYTAAGALVAVTGDQSAAWGSNGLKSMAFTGGPYSLSAGDYYVGLVFNGTQAPNMLKGRDLPFVSGVYATNVGLTAPNFRFARAGSGITTPATAPSTLPAMTSSAAPWWVALS